MIIIHLITKHPPAEAGGFDLRTGSPDTRRPNEAPIQFSLELIVRIWFKVVFKVGLDHLFRHLSYCGTKLAMRPKMSALVPLLQVRQPLKQSADCVAFDPAHDLAWCHIRWRAHQDVRVIFTHYTLHYLDLKRLTHLANQLSDPFRNLRGQYLIPTLRDPHKMIPNLKTV